MSRIGITSVLALLVVSLASCKVYDESMLIEEAVVGAPAGAAGAGIGWWSGADPATQCYSARMPRASDRPTGTPPGDIGDLTFAIRSMRMGARNLRGELDSTAAGSIGFDIDGTCTSSPTCPTGDPILSCSPMSSIPADGKYCRDNMFGQLEYLVETNSDIGGRFKLSNTVFNCSLCQGAYTFLFRIRDYNGQPNDSSIRVDVFPSPGIDDLKPIDCNQYIDKEGWNKDQCWDKSDRWQVQSDYVVSDSGPGIGNSKMYDPSAFVRDGYVVATLPANTIFWFPGDRAVATAFPLTLQGGMVTGKLVKVDDEWVIEDGVIAGNTRWTDSITGFELIGLCPGDPIYAGAQLFAQQSADVLSSGAVSEDATCDAISVGIAFSAGQATIGAAQEVTPLSGCSASDAGATAAP